MTSLSTVSAGLKPPTSMLANRMGAKSSGLSAESLRESAGALSTTTTGAGTDQDIFNVTGKGVLLFAAWGNDNVYTATNTCTLVIDGVQVCQSSGQATQDAPYVMVGSVFAEGTPRGVTYDLIPFNTSARMYANSDQAGIGLYNYYLT